MTSSLSVPVICTICRRICMELTRLTRTPGMVSGSSNFNPQAFQFPDSFRIEFQFGGQHRIYAVLEF